MLLHLYREKKNWNTYNLISLSYNNVVLFDDFLRNKILLQTIQNKKKKKSPKNHYK